MIVPALKDLDLFFVPYCELTRKLGMNLDSSNLRNSPLEMFPWNSPPSHPPSTLELPPPPPLPPPSINTSKTTLPSHHTLEITPLYPPPHPGPLLLPP